MFQVDFHNFIHPLLWDKLQLHVADSAELLVIYEELQEVEQTGNIALQLVAQDVLRVEVKGRFIYFPFRILVATIPEKARLRADNWHGRSPFI